MLVVVILFAMLGLGELIARVQSQRLESRQNAFLTAMPDRIDSMNALNGCVDVIAVGASKTLQGLDTSQLSSQLGAHVYNASLASLSLLNIADWLDRAALSATSPSLVVVFADVGISVVKASSFRAYSHDLALLASPSSSNPSALVRYRALLRDPDTYRNEAGSVADKIGSLNEFGMSKELQADPALDLVFDGKGFDPETDPEYAGDYLPVSETTLGLTLADIKRVTEAHGAKLLVVYAPSPRTEPDYLGDRSAIAARFREAAKAARVETIFLGSTLEDPKYWSDVGHLNHAGINEYAAELAAAPEITGSLAPKCG